MARKSPWQEFADNFDSVYGTFQKVGKNIETKRIMGDKFTEEGGLGFELEGNALEKARYKALGDIYTKYGDADKGLAVRQQLNNLEQTTMANELSRATLEEQKKRNGLLATQIKEAELARINAGVANTNENTTGTKLDNQIKEIGLAEKNTVLSNAELEASFLTDVSNPEWWKSQGIDGEPTEQQRQDALLGMYKNSTIPIDRQLAVETALKTHGLKNLQNIALETAQKAKNEMQKGGVEGLIKWYDGVDDGDATSLELREGVNGFLLVQKSGAEENILYQGEDKSQIEAQLMGQITNPGSGMEIAASILNMQKTRADIEKTKFTIELDGKKFKLTETAAEFNNKLTAANTDLSKVRGEVAKGELSNNTARLALEESRLAWQKNKTKVDQEISRINADANALNSQTNSTTAASQVLLTQAKEKLTNEQVNQVTANIAKINAQTKGLSNTGLTLKDVSKAFLELKVSNAYLDTRDIEEQQAMESLFWSSFPNLVVSGAVPGISKVTKVE